MIEERAHRVFEVAGGDFGSKLMVTRGTGRAVREALEGAGGIAEGGICTWTRGGRAHGLLVRGRGAWDPGVEVCEWEYGDRHLVLVEEDRDLLENVEASLRQRSLAMIRVDEIGAGLGIVGKVPDHLLETLQAIYDAGSITNAALAARLDLNHSLQQQGDQARETRPDPSPRRNRRPRRTPVYLRADRLMLIFDHILTEFSEDSVTGFWSEEVQ